jgi:hypothetical protein
VKAIYSWQFYNSIKLWVLALCQHKNELVLLINPLVQLIIGATKLSVSVKYFPFHVKLFELLAMINDRTNEFIPIAQYMLYPFEQANGNWLNSKSKAMEDKVIPDTLVSLKIAKKHVDTVEMKTRVVKEALDHLTLYFASHSRDTCFPEMVVGLDIVLRKFKKSCNNKDFNKQITTFLELLK